MSDDQNPPPSSPYPSTPDPYGQPANPYGQPADPYGQPQQPAYAQPAYGQPGQYPSYGAAAPGDPDRRPGTVTAGTVIALVTSLISALVFGAALIGIVVARDDVMDSVRDEADLSTTKTTTRAV